VQADPDMPAAAAVSLRAAAGFTWEVAALAKSTSLQSIVGSMHSTHTQLMREQAQPGHSASWRSSQSKLSRAEPSRAEPSRAEPSRAEPSRAEPSRSRAEPNRAEPSRAELLHIMPWAEHNLFLMGLEEHCAD